MALDFVITVNDGGEMIPLTRTELLLYPILPVLEQLDTALNAVLDARAVAKGDYKPEDNDVGITVGFPYG